MDDKFTLAKETIMEHIRHKAVKILTKPEITSEDDKEIKFLTDLANRINKLQ